MFLISGITFSAVSRTTVALDPILLHRSCMFKFLFEKLSRIYLNEIRSIEKFLFLNRAIAGSRGSSISLVDLVKELDLDLTLIFF